MENTVYWIYSICSSEHWYDHFLCAHTFSSSGVGNSWPTDGWHQMKRHEGKYEDLTGKPWKIKYSGSKLLSLTWKTSLRNNTAEPNESCVIVILYMVRWIQSKNTTIFVFFDWMQLTYIVETHNGDGTPQSYTVVGIISKDITMC